MLLPILFPDAESLVVRYLRESLDGVEVHVRVPKDRPSRFVQVRRNGGLANGVQDRPRLDFFAWGPSDEDAKDLAQSVRALMGGIRGTRYGSSVTGVEEFAGLAPAPDQSGAARWFLSIEITVRGTSQ